MQLQSGQQKSGLSMKSYLKQTGIITAVSKN